MKTLNPILRIFRRWGRAWETFWFEADFSSQAVLFRTVFGVFLLSFYLIRTLDLNYFYSDSGIFPTSLIDSLTPLPGRFSILFYFHSDLAIRAFNCIFLASILTMTLGIYPRLSALIAYLLHLSFIHRNFSVVFGVDLISTFFLLYLTLMDVRKREGLQRWLGSAASRFSQIQLCIIYFYSGIEKLKGTHWWQGEAIWDVLANGQLARYDFSFLANFPSLLVLMTYSSLLWEVYFPVLIWNQRLRPAILIFGLFFHAGIGISLNLPHFGALMAVAYLLFLSPTQATRVKGLFDKKNSSYFHNRRLEKGLG